ncbi:MAG TPA: hypothetical protein VNW99_11000 [Cytophagaceae bacterium]|jgi:hypothetical protein|nr:hypothetical protein [Cytophagaceae bacterium]
MVTIAKYSVRQKENGEQFIALILQGEVELVQSKKTGKFYATAKQTSIPSTFPEEICKTLIGKKLPGRIVKEESDQYEYTLPTGEVIELNHTYRYDPDATTIEEDVFEGKGAL